MYKNDSSCAVSITVVRAYKEAVKVAGEVEESMHGVDGGEETHGSTLESKV